MNRFKENFFPLIALLLFTGMMLEASDMAMKKNAAVRFQFDLQGDSHWSRYNFTDIKIPYNGIDGWFELKLAYWLDSKKVISPYISVIPVITFVSNYWWQRNVQLSVGLQVYPFELFTDGNSNISRNSNPKHKTGSFLRNLRLYFYYGWRIFYDKPDEEVVEDRDFQAGMDFYYDTLFRDTRFVFIAWTNAAYKDTNFSFAAYKTFQWVGNTKAGLKVSLRNSLVAPYVVTDWNYTPKYEERWLENFIRVGAGVRWYPKIDEAGGFFWDLVRRFHVYGEVLHNVAWLGDEPGITDPCSVKKIDFRIGFGFATGGYYREKVR